MSILKLVQCAPLIQFYHLHKVIRYTSTDMLRIRSYDKSVFQNKENNTIISLLLYLLWIDSLLEAARLDDLRHFI